MFSGMVIISTMYYFIEGRRKFTPPTENVKKAMIEMDDLFYAKSGQANEQIMNATVETVDSWYAKSGPAIDQVEIS